MTTGVRGEGELSIYKSFTSVIAILWLDCATQYLQLKRGCMHTHEQTNKAMHFYTADVKKNHFLMVAGVKETYQVAWHF